MTILLGREYNDYAEGDHSTRLNSKRKASLSLERLCPSMERDMILLKDLVKDFKHKTVIRGLSLEVSEGEIFGFLGPNGAGKTTTMRLILGLLKPTSGTASVWGQDLDTHPELRQQVGVLLEQDGLYDRLTAQANLDYFARLYKVEHREHRIAELLDMSGLTARRGERVGTFSKGMRRKLGLSRSLLNRPRLLFLDEPASGLDPEARKMVRDLILELASQNITIFLNSHDLDDVQRICNKVAIIRDGQIIASDTVKNLLSRPTRQTFEISFDRPEDAKAAVAVLNERPGVASIESKDSVVRLNLATGASSDLMNDLVAKGIKVSELKRVGSLEDTYLDAMRGEKHE
jgi:ABC-2 type transport system ATP-binding protein